MLRLNKISKQSLIIKSILICCTISLAMFSAPIIFAETLTLNTYNMVPYGAYEQLRLVPRDLIPITDECQIGILYVDTSGILRFCNDDGGGTGEWGFMPDDWTQNDNNIYLTDELTPLDKKVGIGTSAPEFKLTLENDGGIIAKGTFGLAAGADLSTIGAGTRLIWYPKKAAFRAGTVTGIQWDDANVGDYSAAFGNNTTASGVAATAIGNGSTAEGDNSTAMGINTTTETIAPTSTAFGENTTARGVGAIAMGYKSYAWGAHSIAMGAGSGTFGAYSFGIALDDLSGGGPFPTRWIWDPNTMAIIGGSVGIGTVAPSVELDVVGTIRGTQICIEGHGCKLDWPKPDTLTYIEDFDVVGFETAPKWTATCAAGDIALSGDCNMDGATAQRIEGKLQGGDSYTCYYFLGAQLEVAGAARVYCLDIP